MSFDTTVGRWMEQDPAGYIDGPNMYQFEKSNPINVVDPTGEYAQPTTQPTTGPAGQNGNPQPGSPEAVIENKIKQLQRHIAEDRTLFDQTRKRLNVKLKAMPVPGQYDDDCVELTLEVDGYAGEIAADLQEIADLKEVLKAIKAKGGPATMPTTAPTTRPTTAH